MSYDLKSVHTPRLTGTGLKGLVSLLEGTYTQHLLLQPLLRETGLDELRAAKLSFAPIGLPLHGASRSFPLGQAQESRKPVESGELPPAEAEVLWPGIRLPVGPGLSRWQPGPGHCR